MAIVTKSRVRAAKFYSLFEISWRSTQGHEVQYVLANDFVHENLYK
jgi:hypothetical protein